MSNVSTPTRWSEGGISTNNLEGPRKGRRLQGAASQSQRMAEPRTARPGSCEVRPLGSEADGAVALPALLTAQMSSASFVGKAVPRRVAQIRSSSFGATTGWYNACRLSKNADSVPKA